jgi:sugar/nucleoside kinase (ribokinase family)
MTARMLALVAPRVVAIGEVMLDVLGPAVQAGRIHAPVRVRPGGTAVTAALAAAAAGARAAVVGRVGADLSAAAIRDELERAGVEPLLAVDRELPTGTYVELGDSVVAGRGANARLAPEDVPELAADDAVLVSGYAIVHEDTLAAARRGLESAARWRAVTATPLLDEAFLERAVGANVLFANAAEGEELDVEGFEIVCITHGAGGATILRDGRSEHVPPTGETGTGAGDAFAGTFLARL